MSAPQLEIDWGDVPSDMREGFETFHRDNPHVYTKLVSMTWSLVTRGHRRIGMGMLFEVLRWDWMMQTEGDTFKLNNNYRAFYARLLEANNPSLRGVFTKRASQADD